MNLGGLARALDQIAPCRLAEPWDNVGLLIGDPASIVERALLTIDCSPDVIAEAASLGCEAIVSYHPPIFEGLKRVDKDTLAYDLVRRNIGVVCPHTALDAVEGGTNDVLADALQLGERAPLRPSRALDADYKLIVFVPESAVSRVSDALFAAGAGRIGRYSSCSFRGPGVGTFFGEDGTSPTVGRAGAFEETPEVRLETILPIAEAARVVDALRRSHPYEEPAFDLVRVARLTTAPTGMGRIGTLPNLPREAIFTRVEDALGLRGLLVAGPITGEVSRAAVCAGAGRGLLKDAIAQGAQLLVTGELPHHDALYAASRGVTVVCTLHSNSERKALGALKSRLDLEANEVAFHLSATDRDPFAIRSR